MSTQKKIYICNSCGNEFSRWSGQCSMCQEWNSLQELKLSKATGKQSVKAEKVDLETLDSIKFEQTKIVSGIEEFDRVLGGGIVNDSLILLTGDPGVGKSTLSGQVFVKIADKKNVIYFSGEESVNQVSSRLNRLQTEKDNKKQSNKLQIAATNSLESILITLEKTKEIDLIVIDSIQTIYSETIPSVAGSLSQVKYCAEAIMQYVKKRGIACILIGHVNKDGALAGPQTLAHLVDVVLYLEGDKYHQFRMLRGQKKK